MKSTHKIIIPLFMLFALITGVANAGNNKVSICHIPPGNPANFHTITVSENAYSAHLAHGDLAGACDETCATLCDDGNACTIDDTGDCEQQGCPVVPEAVDCNDGNECTYDTCDPVTACVNDPEPQVGQMCNDSEICSGPDQCNAAGECVGLPIDNCCLGDEDCSQNQCDRAACNLDSNQCADDPVQCDPSDLCQVSMCAPDDGMCYETPIMCDEGETCNPTSGMCESEPPPAPGCPCWTHDDGTDDGGNPLPNFDDIVALMATRGGTTCEDFDVPTSTTRAAVDNRVGNRYFLSAQRNGFQHICQVVTDGSIVNYHPRYNGRLDHIVNTNPNAGYWSLDSTHLSHPNIDGIPTIAPGDDHAKVIAEWELCRADVRAAIETLNLQLSCPVPQ